jgi:hypothetical protein
MGEQIRKTEQFRALHISGKPLVLFNIWDAGSAKAAAAGGAKAIATSSWSMANANGFADGERIPLAMVIEDLRRIVGVTELPVTVDLESGYGEGLEMVGETIAAAIDGGPSAAIWRTVFQRMENCVRQSSRLAASGACERRPMEEGFVSSSMRGRMSFSSKRQNSTTRAWLQRPLLEHTPMQKLAQTDFSRRAW